MFSTEVFAPNECVTDSSAWLTFDAMAVGDKIVPLEEGQSFVPERPSRLLALSLLPNVPLFSVF